MSEMMEQEQLEEVKKSLNIEGDYQDETLLVYIREIKEYLADAGVPREKLETSAIIGILSRGVSDLWNYGAGTGKLSPYFKERVIQLAI